MREWACTRGMFLCWFCSCVSSVTEMWHCANGNSKTTFAILMRSFVKISCITKTQPDTTPGPLLNFTPWIWLYALRLIVMAMWWMVVYLYQATQSYVQLQEFVVIIFRCVILIKGSDCSCTIMVGSWSCATAGRFRLNLTICTNYVLLCKTSPACDWELRHSFQWDTVILKVWWYQMLKEPCAKLTGLQRSFQLRVVSVSCCCLQ